MFSRQLLLNIGWHKHLQLVSIARTIYISNNLNHNPGLKKRTKSALDPKKQQRQLERQEAKLRKQVISPPPDPDSLPDPTWYNDNRKRELPNLTDVEQESRILLQKEWSRYQMSKHKSDLKMIRDKLKCRSDALYELKRESEFLYNECIKLDKDNFPLSLKGPMETPQMKDYQPPDFVDEKH